MSRNIQQTSSPYLEEARPTLKERAAKKHAKIPALLKSPYAQDHPPSSDFTPYRARAVFEPYSWLFNPEESRWMREAIEAFQAPIQDITPHDFINSISWLYDLAAPNSEATNLKLNDEKIGQTVPLKELERYLSANPKAAPKAQNLILSAGETYRHLHDHDHILANSNDAFLLVIIKRDEQWRVLAIVNNAMHESMRQAQLSNVFKTANKPPIRKSRIHMDEIPQWHYRNEAENIISDCANNKAAMVFTAFSGTSFPVAAVPYKFARKMRKSFFTSTPNSTGKIKITDLYRQSKYIQRVAQSRNFIKVMKSKGGQFPKFKPVFTLIPFSGSSGVLVGNFLV